MGDRMVKTILVHLTGQPEDGAALETGYLIARLFAAHIEGVHMSPSWTEFAASMAAQSIETAISPVEVIAAFEAEVKNAGVRAKSAFDELCERRKIPQVAAPVKPEDVTASWREIMGSPDRILTSEARFYDLCVVSRSQDSAIHSLLLNVGKPVVVAPPKALESMSRTVAIAWKEKAEAARAITAAMPLLEKAGKVLVIAADEGTGPDPVLGSTARVVEMLAWHRIKAEAHCVNPGGRSVANAIVQCAIGNKADLLVMGAYGHSRMREFILGGVTRDILQECALPVFLFH